MGEKNVREGATVVNYAIHLDARGDVGRQWRILRMRVCAHARAPTGVTSHGDSSRNNLHAMQPVMR